MRPRVFVSVPPGDLSVQATMPPSVKDDQATIDRLLLRLQGAERLVEREGWSAERVLALRHAPLGTHEHELGDAYYEFYDTDNNSSFLKASWVNGRIEVDNGHHRVRRAQQLGVTRLPVRVSVPDDHIGRLVVEKYA